VRKKSVAFAVGVLTAVGMVAGASPSQAISRVSCTSYNYLWVQSNQTTCWANAGTAYVSLYSVTGLSSGNNAGYLHAYLNSNGAGYTVYFGKFASTPLSTSRVDVVHIN
jgi:hypothetical protein